MASEKVLDYNALGQAVDTTWGRSSTPSGASQSVKFKILGEDKIEVLYAVIVNLVNDREMVDLKKKYTAESNDVIDGSLKRVKEVYKDLSESNIRFKQVSDTDSFEIINLNIYNRKRTAYFRRRVVYEMS